MPRTKRDDDPPPVHLRRMYVDCRYGQMHLRSALSATGGFDERTPLVCLHHSPSSGRVFDGFLRLMGTDRPAFAPDLPGCGESDPPGAPPGVADNAAAIGDFLDQLRLRRVDLLGHHTGACIAAELALARPGQVRRVVMVGVPMNSAAARERLPRITQPVLVLRPRDDLWDVTPRARELLPAARFVDLPEQGPDLFDVGPDVLARHVQAFLDG